MEWHWDQLAEAALRRELRALSRLISGVENRIPGWRRAMSKLTARTGNARIIGITGPPGSGKSTLTGRLAACFDDRGWDVAIVAVDPSSMRSGGALLGDRLRMREFSRDNIFVRSLASRGTLGGLSQATRDVIRILDAFGKTLVLLETVGAGQGEVDVAESPTSSPYMHSRARRPDPGAEGRNHGNWRCICRQQGGPRRRRSSRCGRRPGAPPSS